MFEDHHNLSRPSSSCFKMYNCFVELFIFGWTFLQSDYLRTLFLSSPHPQKHTHIVHVPDSLNFLNYNFYVSGGGGYCRANAPFSNVWKYCNEAPSLIFLLCKYNEVFFVCLFLCLLYDSKAWAGAQIHFATEEVTLIQQLCPSKLSGKAS